MRKQKLLRGVKLLLAVSLIISSGFGVAHAETLTSPHYKATETQFGSTQQSCSGQYCAQASIGDGTTATSGAETSTVKLEDVTNNVPQMDVSIESGASNLGVLSTQATATKTTTIRIRNYLTGGYSLQIIGDPPKYDGHALHTETEPTASSAGLEQFGINVVANTSPVVGANPVQIPDGQGDFGIVNDNYHFSNLFMYTSQATIAHSKKDSGHTDYTISMIVNISNSTPAGHYSGDFAAIVVPGF